MIWWSKRVLVQIAAISRTLRANSCVWRAGKYKGDVSSRFFGRGTQGLDIDRVGSSKAVPISETLRVVSWDMSRTIVRGEIWAPFWFKRESCDEDHKGKSHISLLRRVNVKSALHRSFQFGSPLRANYKNAQCYQKQNSCPKKANTSTCSLWTHP